ncbi:GH36-type glycosyl hydrolase domain-containing protein [Clostridium isatidis]|uniref:GH36-type glycosyl hydrolase domain-containing protein n=1 Tax=Clostridium isatidis TaxID=182773 RepID=UPI003AAC141A
MKKNTINNTRKNVLKEINYAFKGIVHNYKYLSKLHKQGEEIIPSAEWILDNIYLIEKEYKTIKFNMPIEYFNNIPIELINDVEYPRIYILAKEYVNQNNNKIDENEAIKFINKVEENLTMGELWAFPLMVRAVLIINLAKIIKEIAILQRKRTGAKELANKVIDYYNKGKIDVLLKKLEEKYPIENTENIEVNIENQYIAEDESLYDKKFSSEFMDKFLSILRDNFIDDERIYKFALDRLQVKDISHLDNQVKKDQMHEVNAATDIGITINSLRSMDAVNWKRFFNETSQVEKILEEDISNAYKYMDFQTKDYYRHQIEKISKKTNIREVDIAKRALELSKENANNDEEYKKHIGYYIVDDGLKELLRSFNINKKINKTMSQGLFLSVIIFGTILLDLVILLLSYLVPLDFTISQYIFAFITMLVPCSEVIISLFYWLVPKIIPVSHVPKLDYLRGIPEDAKTIVVIPSIFSSAKEVEKLVERLEIYYLGNRDKNIYFAILGDLKDSKYEEEVVDIEINNKGLELIEKLNDKYCVNKEDKIFYFFNRKRLYNKSERAFIGYERKRGKIVEFMALIKGYEDTSYNVISSNIDNLKDVKYLITLDADTFLPLEAAKKLIGAMSHPLNKPYIENSKVKRGYSIMQPKVTVDLEEKHKTYFAKIFAGDSGIDAYSTASSDVYQDIFKEGIFTGKGIIEIESFYNLLKYEIPENKVLSHDLLEGVLTRCALVTDVEFIDSYPLSYMASALRLHRWVRGDWQIFRWIFSKKLSLISKWKIIDNLRRSLLSPALIIALLASLSILKGAVQIALLVFLVLILPVLFTITDFVVTPKNKLNGVFKSLKQIILIASFTPSQGYLMTDAIIRSIYRMLISKKKLLEWKTAARVEKSVKNTYSWYYMKMAANPILAAVLFILCFNNSRELLLFMLPLIILWLAAPALACYISKEKVYIKERLEIEDEEFLRENARRIWAYYEDFVNEENNYLAPDNYQEKPYKGVAYRTSPTNIGMGLISNVVAYDFGYISMGELIYRLEVILDNIKDLEKYKGHLLNWYETKTKKPLWPRYVSTVDSGNLLGYLWIIKETIDKFKDVPIIREREITALFDSYNLIRIDDKKEIQNNISDNINLREYKQILKEELERIKPIAEEGKKEFYWTKKLKNELEKKLDFYDYIFTNVEELLDERFSSFKAPSLNEIIENLEEIKLSLSEELQISLDKDLNKIIDFKDRIDNLSEDIDKMIKEMKFDFLYDKDRDLFAIGYNLEEQSLGNSYYDLMASEARIVSLLAIAKGEVPRKHWYKLSRNMTKAFNQKALASWSGTMFEYFMPYQILKNYRNTIWDLTYKSVITAQKYYGENKNVPWGISESGYYDTDINQNYQYKAFGVPGIGLKRGLEENLVISPYSTMMALPYDALGAIENLRKLHNEGYYGRYGFIEAIDYSEGEKGEELIGKEVRSYMVHHLGMSLLALDNVINDDILKERFHSIPEIKAVEVLLKEKVPENITFTRETGTYNNEKLNIEKEDFIPRIFRGYNRENPEVLLLSNGSYSIMINNSGSGYSKRDNLTVYRWKGDSTSDASGMLFYIKDLDSDKYWSPSYEPCKEIGNDYSVEFTVDKAKFTRKDEDIETNYEVSLASDDDVEIRKISLKNNGDEEKNLELTSYLEVTLRTFEGDVVHPAFSNLFISTDYNEELKALIGNRRKRSENEKTHYIFHTIEAEEDIDELTYETSRLNFIGRNKSLKSPKAMEDNNVLENTVGIVLDPIMSLRCKIKLMPKEEKSIYYLTGVSDAKEELLNLIRKYKNISTIEKAVNCYNYKNVLELKHIGIRSAQANIYQSFASHILYLNSKRKNREEYIKNINKSQEDLWPYGISGDLPIIFLEIYKEKDIDLLRQVINMHYYFKIKGLKCDLVVYNHEELSYEEPLQKNIVSTINNSLERDNLNKNGGVFLHNKATMPMEIRDFLIGISNLYINSKDGSLVKQLKSEDNYKIEEDLSHLERMRDNIRKSNYYRKLALEQEITDVTVKKKENNHGNNNYLEENNLNLDFFNGYGGFNRENNSYVIKLKNYESTPAPWINVISNDKFGFHISEVGSSYNWCENSRENKITPWSNDWVIDPASEALYIRDKDLDEAFTITPMPIRDSGEYIIEHGFGYSSFSHSAYDIKGEMIVFSPLNEKLKLCKVKLKNLADKDRELSVTYYAQLVLGVYNYQSSKYITTEIRDNYILGRNPYSKYFGKLKAYLSINGLKDQSFTGDRKAFIGIGGDIEYPVGVYEDKLNNKAGSIYDPCLSSKIDLKLKAKDEIEFVVIFGQEEEDRVIEEKIEKYSSIEQVKEEIRKVKDYWANFLGNIQVKTPDLSMDYMLNGWLLYQTLACRYLARTAFYQSGGAYGFRDQLQDSLALGIVDPKITRDQIIRSASRQYVEGDVQHWWHPIINSGIRTKFSDDLLWMPYVTAQYIKTTGDYSILEEKANYLEDEPLKAGEDERYTIVPSSNIEGTIYEHCLKAIDKALKFGPNNIPLMGSGDWNDGMSTVGNKGSGESVWLGWFLYSILDSFKEICDYKKDRNKAEEYEKFQKFIKENIEENAWDGNWYRRAYFDNGEPLGSKENPECKIDSIAQSWSIISKAANPERQIEAMNSVDKYLVDKDNGLIKLLAPPFDSSHLEPGYIKGYVPGVRENGGQYTHAAIWVILALTKLGLGDKAVNYYNMINPINHSRSERDARRYKLEPYVIAADVYVKEPHGGRGGWSWYTGSSGWMYSVGIKNILGLKTIGGKYYKIEPCIPRDWKEYEIKIKNDKEEYNIKVVRGENKGTRINGKLAKDSLIPKNKGKLEVEITI